MPTKSLEKTSNIEDYVIHDNISPIMKAAGLNFRRAWSTRSFPISSARNNHVWSSICGKLSGKQVMHLWKKESFELITVKRWWMESLPLVWPSYSYLCERLRQPPTEDMICSSSPAASELLNTARFFFCQGKAWDKDYFPYSGILEGQESVTWSTRKILKDTKPVRPVIPDRYNKMLVMFTNELIAATDLEKDFRNFAANKKKEKRDGSTWSRANSHRVLLTKEQKNDKNESQPKPSPSTTTEVQGRYPYTHRRGRSPPTWSYWRGTWTRRENIPERSGNSAGARMQVTNGC